MSDDEAIEQVAFLLRKLEVLSRPVLEELRSLLDGRKGASCNEPSKNREFAKVVRELTDRLGYDVECPRCNQPAYFTTHPLQPGKGKYTAGAFIFHHQGGKSTHGGQAKFPVVRLKRKKQD